MHVARLAGSVLAFVGSSSVALAQVAYESPPQLSSRIRQQMVGDAGRVLMTGGTPATTTSSSNALPEVWSFANGAWSAIGAIAGLDPLADATYDPLRQRLVGLIDEGATGIRLLEWDGVQTTTYWNAPISLYYCEQHELTFDPSRGAVVVHGYDLQTAANELWSYDGLTWLPLSTAAGPGWGSWQLLSVAGGDLLLVGMPWGGTSLETWRWRAGVWSSLPAPALAPFRYDAAADLATGLGLLVGYAPGATVMSVYLWNGAGWTLLASGGPDLGSEFRIATDGTQLLMFGGVHYGTPSVYHGESWSFAAGAFTLLGGQPPEPLDGLAAGYDAVRKRTVVQGWNGQQTQTWEWDGSQFVLRQSVPGPVGETAMAYDRVRGVVVQHRSDGTTMEWNGTTWTTVVPAGVGPSRYGAGLAFDGQRVLLFGGVDPAQPGSNNQTWAFDGLGWSQLAPATSPPTGLAEVRLVEDPRRGVVVLLASRHNTVYEWNGSAWATVGSVPWTELRDHQFVGYHPARGQVVVGAGQKTTWIPSPPFGGYWSTTATREVWRWDGTGFQPLANTPDDHVRSAAVAGPDGDLLLLGGRNAQGQLRADLVVMRSLYPANVTTFGGGCAGSVSTAAVDAEPWQWPWLGDVVTLGCRPLPPTAAAVVWVLGLSRTQDAFGMLPRDLTAIGAPGCMQRVAVDAWWVEPAAANASSTSVWVPPDPALRGLATHLQVLIPDPSNPFGFVLSDAVTATIGER